MKKNIFWIGIIILAIGLVLFYLAGATLPYSLTIPVIYQTNQAYWLGLSLIGLIIAVIGLTMKSGSRIKKEIKKKKKQ